MAAIDHLENLQRAAVGAAAGVATDRSNELRRMAQCGGNLIGQRRTAMDDDQALTLAYQRSHVVGNSIVIDTLRATDFGHQHRPSLLFLECNDQRIISDEE